MFQHRRAFLFWHLEQPSTPEKPLRSQVLSKSPARSSTIPEVATLSDQADFRSLFFFQLLSNHHAKLSTAAISAKAITTIPIRFMPILPCIFPAPKRIVPIVLDTIAKVLIAMQRTSSLTFPSPPSSTRLPTRYFHALFLGSEGGCMRSFSASANPFA